MKIQVRCAKGFVPFLEEEFSDETVGRERVRFLEDQWGAYVTINSRSPEQRKDDETRVIRNEIFTALSGLLKKHGSRAAVVRCNKAWSDGKMKEWLLDNLPTDMSQLETIAAQVESAQTALPDARLNRKKAEIAR